MAISHSTIRRDRREQPMVEKIMLIPLIDILTIMVVFLISSYNMADLVPTKSLTLPLSTAAAPPFNVLKVSVSQEDIRVEDRSVVPLDRGKIPRAFMDKLLIVPLYDNLAIHAERRRALLEKKPELDKSFASEVVMIADKDTPASIVDSVLYTIAQHKFTKFQLMVSKKPLNNSPVQPKK